MAENSKIEWCDHTFSPWLGCQHVSPGCERCFAESWSKRSGLVEWGPHGERKRTSADYWKQPLRWARKAREERREYNEIVRLAPEFGEHSLPPLRPRVFCASLCDVFDNQVQQEWRTDLFRLIDATPELDWLLLTKRPENMRIMLPRACGEATKYADRPWPWPNIWLGFTAEDQEHFNRRWPIVRDIPAAVRFCSYEPALGPLTLPDDVSGHLNWIIAGSESGHGARPMSIEWPRLLRDECLAHDVRFFAKQLTGKGGVAIKDIEKFPADLRIREFPRAAA